MTVKKFIALTSAALAATALTASAQVAVDVVSAYVFRGGTINDEFNVQPGFDTTAFGGAVSVGTWANFNTDTSEFDEIDYFFGIPLPVGEDSPISVEVGYCEYVYNVGGEADREPYIAFGMGDISLGIYYGVGGLIEDSMYLELGYGTSIAVAENLGLDVSAALGYVDPDEGKSGFSHLTLSAGTAIAIPETEYSVSVGITYVVETDDKVLEVDEDFYFTVGTTL
ncbi:MAG: hypothetical protein ACO3N7_08415 [Kiritimatiellia bacterium]